MTTPLSHYAEVLKLTSLQPPSPASLAARLSGVKPRMAEALLNNSKQQSPPLFDLGTIRIQEYSTTPP